MLYWSDSNTKKASCNEISYLVSERGEVAIEFPRSDRYPREHRVQILQFGKAIYDAVLTKHLDIGNDEVEQLNKDVWQIVGFKTTDKCLPVYWTRTLSPEMQAIARAVDNR